MPTAEKAMPPTSSATMSMLMAASDQPRLVVSEPIGSLRGAWQEVPEGTCVIVRNGREEQHPFVPTVLEPVG